MDTDRLEAMREVAVFDGTPSPDDDKTIPIPLCSSQLLGELDTLHRHTAQHITTGKGCHLIRTGQLFRDLYVIYAGSFRGYGYGHTGKSYDLGAFLKGDIIGFDAIETGRHRADFVAQETSEVLVLPLDTLHAILNRHPILMPEILRLAARSLDPHQ